jgi:hypothetical protein
VRPQDFIRQRQLTFPLLMLFLLQQTVKSIQRHLHEFLDELAQGQLFEPVSRGAVTHARAKLKESAFRELNRDCVQPALYGSEHPVRRWRGHRLVGFDSSLVRQPESQELGQAFGWQEVSNQNGATGTRYPEARLSVVYEVLNRAGWDTRLEPSPVGEVALASQQLEQLQPGDIEINDRDFTGYLYRLEWGCGRRILLLAVGPVPFWRPKSSFGLTEPTKARSSGSLLRRTRKPSASAWGCR